MVDGLLRLRRQLHALIHALGAFLGRHHRGVGRFLDFGEDGLHLRGGLTGLLGEGAHFHGDDGEALAILARAGGLDGGVERQHIGLSRNLVDSGDDLADLLRLLGEGQDVLGDAFDALLDAAHTLDGFLDGLLAATRDFDGALGGGGDFLRARRGLFGDGLDLIDGGGGLGDGGGLLAGAGGLLGGGGEDFGGGGAEVAGGVVEAAEHLAQAGAEGVEVVLEEVEVALEVGGDGGGDVAPGDALDVVGGHIERLDDGIHGSVYSLDDAAEVALVAGRIGAGGQLAGNGALGEHVGVIDEGIDGDDADIEVVLDLVEVAAILVGDGRGDVALGDAFHVFPGHVERADDGIQRGVHAFDDLTVRALEGVCVTACSESPFHGGLCEHIGFSNHALQCLLHLSQRRTDFVLRVARIDGEAQIAHGYLFEHTDYIILQRVGKVVHRLRQNTEFILALHPQSHPQVSITHLLDHRDSSRKRRCDIERENNRGHRGYDSAKDHDYPVDSRYVDSGSVKCLVSIKVLLD